MQIEEICNVIMRLYLYADNLKMIHYSTSGNHYHQLCDSIRECIIKFADELAEEIFGYYGKPKYNDFKLNQQINQTNDLSQLCVNIINSIEYYRKEFNKDIKLSGVVSLIDDFKGEMLKYKFLCTFDKVTEME